MNETKIDPITFEILQHRIWQITQEMGIALVRVSGSVITVDAKDYMVALYDGEGTMIMSGCGVIFHATTTQYGVRHIIENYSENPGIADGDAFLINDPYISSLHTADAAILSPIYYKGERVGWSASMTHLMDNGGSEPGGFCPTATSIFNEGFRFSGIKIAERGEVRKDVLDSILNMSRDPGMVGLDIKAQLAAAKVAKQRVVDVIKLYGPETYKAMCNQLITYAEMRMRARLSELPDGTWRTVEYLDDDGKTDRIYKIALQMTKEGDSLTFDFTGTDEEAPTFINCGTVGARGAVFGALAPLLAYDIPWNEGVFNPVEVIVPEGTLIKAKFPSPCSMGTIGGADLAHAPAQQCISKMLDCSREYKDDATALWGTEGGSVCLSGIGQYGNFFVTILMDAMAVGGGAKPYADGVNSAGMFWIPESSIPNVETNELNAPVLYLYRRHSIDSGGPGKYRGGVSGEFCVMLHDAPTGTLNSVRYGFGTEAAMNFGLCGGYPSRNVLWRVVSDTDIIERLERGDLPTKLEEMKGNLKELKAIGVLDLMEKDVLFFSWHGGGGYGDPLDRDPRSVSEDVENEFVSIESALDVYGVVLDPQSLEVNLGKTEQKRKEMREKRLATSMESNTAPL